MPTLVNSRGFQLSWIVLMASALMLRYRKGSLGDASYYISNGEQILSRVNPYESGFRSGPLGAVALNVLLGRIPINLAEIMILVSGLLGCAIFAFALFPNQRSLVLMFVPVSIIFSSNRELLVNHQINGIILILIAGFWFLRGTSSKIGFLAATLCAAVAVDLKPHIALPILVVLFFAEKNLKGGVATLFWVVLAHLLCNFWLRTVTEVKWLQNLSDISKDDPWADVANIWPLLGHLPVADEILKLLATLSYLAVTAILGYFAFQRSKAILVLVALSTPVIGIYSHLYDLGALFFLSLLISGPSRKSPLFYLFFNFVIVFKSFNSFEGFFLLTVANIYIFLLFKSSENESSKSNLRSLGLGLLLYFCYQFGVSNLSLAENDIKSLTICVVTLLAICLAQHSLSKENFGIKKIKQ